MLSVGNATRLLRALPKRTFASISGTAANQAALRTRSPFTQQKSAFSMRHLSSTSSNPLTKASPATATTVATSSSPFLQGQAIRHFSRRAWRDDHEAFRQAARDYWASASRNGSAGGGFTAGENLHHHHHELHKHWGRRCGGFRGFHHHHHGHHMRRRRPIRFLFRMATLSALVVAVPAIVFLDAPFNTLGYVPLTVFGTGAVLMLAGRLLYVFLPVAVIGGATMFWIAAMPAADQMKDLRKIMKRDKEGGRHSTTALSTLGSEWEIQKARPDEWFQWTFPERGDAKQLDKINIRMAVFDPNDSSSKKERSLRKFDKFEEKCKKSGKMHHDFPEGLDIRRDGDQIVIKMEENGEKLMEQKMAKKYLALGRIVNKAATEMEAAQPGLKLGEQVVLVHKNKHSDAFWAQWSPFGGLSLRIPFNRTWVDDLSDL
ncbi:hypothetical protein BGZ98_002083 [Dissophora globulifera]|nr:hypothetical protein BGZ98_002083 [Dissophora globulifera]